MQNSLIVADSPALTSAFAVVRSLHLLACLLLLSMPAFDQALIPRVARQVGGRSWRRGALTMLGIAAPAALLSGIAWLAMVTIQMSGLPLNEALQPGLLRTVLTQTHFGRLWTLRLIAWAFCTGCSWRCLSSKGAAPGVPGALGAAGGALLAASLAWAGHGLTGPGPLPHLSADVLHLVISALWPIGLLPFWLLLRSLHRSADPRAGKAVAQLTERFSFMSLSSVALLFVTGIINSWALLGSIRNLWTSQYGQWLLLKIAVFGAMQVLGAVNLLWWKPRLRRICSESAAGRLMNNVLAELILALLILLIIGWLGQAEPSRHVHVHAHHQDTD